jgi:hypothetical protein
MQISNRLPVKAGVSESINDVTSVTLWPPKKSEFENPFQSSEENANNFTTL